ncbi:MAG: oligosaccharide flippase family protein [Desulfobacteraceae bacterium]
MEKVVESVLHRLPFLSRRLDGHMLEVVNGAALALGLKVVGAGLTFCFNILLARTLGAEGAGVYFLALTFTTIATLFGRMGLDNALLKFTAANAAIDNWQAVSGLYRKGMKLALPASAGSALIMFAAAPWLAGLAFNKPELTTPMRWMALAVVPLTLLILHAEMLKGLKRIGSSLLVYGVGVPALSLVLLYFLGRPWGVNGAVWAYALAAGFTALLGMWLWRSAAPHVRTLTGHFETRELLQSSLPLFWVASLNLVISWTAIFALGLWGTKEDIGVFSIAARTAMLTSLILLSVNSISAPKFAGLYKTKQMAALASTARNTAKLMTLLASPLLMLFLLFPQDVMGLFGPGFTGGAALLSILAAGQFVNVGTGSVGYLLMMSGNERLLRNNLAFMALLNVLLNVALVPAWGALGAALATAVCLALTNLIAAYLVWSRLGIWTIPWLGRISVGGGV